MYLAYREKILFFAAFFVGTFAIILLKKYEFSGLFVIGIPIALMLAYFSVALWLRDKLINDNVYYLGFLYTMVSIAYSLYQVGGSDNDIPSIVTNFGLALTTTILGLALRVFSDSEKSEKKEDGYHPRDALNDATGEMVRAARYLEASANAINNELKLTADVCGGFRRSLEDALGDSSKGLVGDLNALLKTIENTAAGTAEAVQESQLSLKRQLAKITQEVTSELRSAITDMSSFRREMKEAVESSTKDTVKNMENVLAGAARSVSEKVSGISSTIEDAGSLLSSRAGSSSEKLDKAVDSAASRILDFSKKIDEFSKRIESIKVPKKIIEEKRKRRLRNLFRKRDLD